MVKTLALNSEGNITYCSVAPENRGKGRCNHVEHQNKGESVENFIERINDKQIALSNKDHIESSHKEITQEQINKLADSIDNIAGETVTIENFKKVIGNLSPDKIDQITKLSFEAAPVFSLPITDENYEDENMKNKLYFANLPAYGIGGNTTSVKQMFDKIGDVPTLDGVKHVDNSYKKGLTPGEYFLMQFRARDALINKGVTTSEPGYCIYANSIVETTQGKIPWKELEIGDVFIDGSIVVELQPWNKKKCYELQINGFDKIVLSYDHLINGDIIIDGKIIDYLEKSELSRKYVGESDKKWICIEDIYEFYNLGAQLSLSDGSKLVYIKPFKDLEEQKVRCISSNTGFYETNGLIHHNTARQLFYCMSDTQVSLDCGGPYIDVMHCKMPEGHVCEKCAHLTKGGENVKQGQLIGGIISTNMSEALTQLSMKQMHIGSSKVTEQQNDSRIIMGTLDAWNTSPIIRKMSEAETTEDMREILYNGLKEQYANAGIKQDDFNLQMVAKKLTGYKRNYDDPNNKIVPVNPGERCDIVSIGAAGNMNNIFKMSELGSGYKHLTKPISQKLGIDAANQILK